MMALMKKIMVLPPLVGERQQVKCWINNEQ